MTAFEPVRIGVIGVGNFGRLHALTLAGLAEADLVALVDTDADRRAAIQRELPGALIFSSLDAALTTANADAWVVATRTETHIPIATQLLTTNPASHILIEKPLAQNLTTARQLEPLLADNPNRVMVGHILLYAAEFRQLLREIDQRGELVYFHSFRHRPTFNWNYYREIPFRLLMIHDLYLAFALVGGAEPTHVSARLHQRADGGYDLARAELEWPTGTWGSFTASYLTPPGMSAEGFDRLEVFGHGWAGQIRALPQPLDIWADKHEWPLTLDVFVDPVAPSGWLAEELRHFCRVVRGQVGPPLGARYRDALQIQGWLERIEAAAGVSDTH